MADNTTLNPGTGGDVVASDDIGGVKFQRVKVVIGADGVNGGDVSAANPVPMTAAALPLPTGAATAANQATVIAGLASIDAATAAIRDRATFPVTGTFWQATQPVSIASWAGLTDAQLRATAVPVSIASWAGLTDTQLRANPVAVASALQASLLTTRLPINIVTTTLSTLVVAAAGQTIRVHRLKFTVSGATAVTIRRGSTVLEVLTFSGPGAVSLAFDPYPWYVTAANEAFTMQSSAAVTITGSVEFVQSA